MIRRRPFLWISFAAAAVFALYASIFLCFFVDDEAIPLVYARNLLRGRGLIYTALEGRMEGYSDFLHVIWSAGLLGVAGALGLPDLAPIAIGKAVSFLAGIGVVLVSARTMWRAGASTPGLVGGLAVLVLAGPLALWSCSSLETAMFALLVSALASVVFIGSATEDGKLPLRVATALGVLVILERIDGFIYAGAVIAASLIAVPARRRLLGALAWRLALAAAVFHGARYAYFGSLLSAPLAAKVLHIFAGPANAVVNEPAENYLRSFLAIYGVVAAPVFLAGIWAAWNRPAARAAAIALVALGTYVGLVGDWMFGWRFTVALLPLAALIVALGITRVPVRFGWVVAFFVVAWTGLAAIVFVDAFKDARRWPIFWTRPATGLSAWVSPYGELLSAARGLLRPGERVAYNQAGILAYALDIENIDDLGICSRFVARLPTTDVHYTRVGRYSPLTNRPILFTAHAYLLYHDVRFLVSRTNLLRGANGGRIPDVLLDGHFRLLLTDASGVNAVYERTARSTAAYRQDPSLFTENLAHTSRLVRATIDREVIEPRDFASRLAFFQEGRETLAFDAASQLDVQFAERDEDVFRFYAGTVSASAPAIMTLVLFAEDGRQVARKEIPLGAGTRSVLEQLDAGVHARALSIRLRMPQGGRARITIADVRLAGQSAALREYVRDNLRFAPADGAAVTKR